MSKTQSGIVLILIAVIMNVVGGMLAQSTVEAEARVWLDLQLCLCLPPSS